MDLKKLFKPLILALAAGSFTVAAVAQWQWLDKDGRKVYSDRSPPADIQEKNILKRPTGSVRVPSPSEAGVATAAVAKPSVAGSAPAAKASAPKLSGKDAELEAKKKKAEEDETAKKKVEEEKMAKTKSENCDRAKNGLATLQSGVRMASVNAKGEREVYDEAKRAAETKRTQEVIDENCK
jgi:hypothetical protein